MSKLITCKSCDKEVSKEAKTCPNCGAKLKMGFFKKILIGIIGLAVIGAFFGMSPEEKAAKLTDTLAQIEQTSPSGLKSGGELSAIFSYNSDFTDLQREDKEKEIKGQIVEWTLPVFEVERKDESERKYRIQTSSGRNSVGAFVNVYARSDDEAKQIESLKTGDMFSFKGRITGTFMRSIQIDDAIIRQAFIKKKEKMTLFFDEEDRGHFLVPSIANAT